MTATSAAIAGSKDYIRMSEKLLELPRSGVAAKEQITGGSVRKRSTRSRNAWQTADPARPRPCKAQNYSLISDGL